VVKSAPPPPLRISRKYESEGRGDGLLWAVQERIKGDGECGGDGYRGRGGRGGRVIRVRQVQRGCRY